MMRRDRLRRTAKLTRKYAKRLCAENPYADFNEALVQIMLQNRPKRYYDKSEESNFKKVRNTSELNVLFQRNLHLAVIKMVKIVK